MMYRVKHTDRLGLVSYAVRSNDYVGFMWKIVRPDPVTRTEAIRTLAALAKWTEAEPGKYATWKLDEVKFVRVKVKPKKTGYRVRLKGGMYAGHYGVPNEADEKWHWCSKDTHAPTNKATALRLMAMMLDYHARCECDWDPSNLVLVRVK